MKVLVLETDRYSERPIEKEVVELKGEVKLTERNIGLVWKETSHFKRDPVDEEDELKKYVPDLSKFYENIVFSYDKSTCHISGEERDIIMVVL